MSRLALAHVRGGLAQLITIHFHAGSMSYSYMIGRLPLAGARNRCTGADHRNPLQDRLDPILDMSLEGLRRKHGARNRWAGANHRHPLADRLV